MRCPPTTKTICLLLTASMLAGCASIGRGPAYVPMVDTKDKDAATLAADVAQCQAYAKQQADAATSAAIGAIAGALFGVALAAAAGSGYSRTASARVGALTGAVGAASSGTISQEDTIRRCLAGRGYVVLN